MVIELLLLQDLISQVVQRCYTATNLSKRHLNPSDPRSPEFVNLVEAVVQAIVAAGQNQSLADALTIRDEINRLPASLITEVLNDAMLRLIRIDPILCRWFILDVFLHDADPQSKADVAERINLLFADLQSS